jgi:TonB family protein
VSNEWVKHPPRTTLAMLAAIAICSLSAVAWGQKPAIQKIKDVRPVYPRESLQAGDEGMVIVELSVTAGGAVGEARILWSQCKRLDQAALTAVQQWQFSQARVNGSPVPFTVVADLPFRLPPRFKARAGRAGACKWTEPPKRLSLNEARR